MKKIYSPWRHNYVAKTDKSSSLCGNACLFCLAEDPEQTEMLILKKLPRCFITLNKFPYSTGHVLIVPYEHGEELYLLSKETNTEVFLAARKAMQILKVAVRADGFNLGLNIGAAGGSGIRSHSHVHVIPRWEGDTNFMVSAASTKVICSSIDDIFQTLLPQFETLNLDD